MGVPEGLEVRNLVFYVPHTFNVSLQVSMIINRWPSRLQLEALGGSPGPGSPKINLAIF